MNYVVDGTKSSWRESDPGMVDRLVKGAIDLHCHSGPSVMPRYFTHYEAMQEASEAGLRAILIKDHYYSATPTTEMLNKHFKHLGVKLLSGVPLNNQTGGLNIYAVEHGIALGAKMIWMPTFASANHIAHHHQAGSDFQFPKARKPMLQPKPLTVVDESGKLLPEVLPILDMIAEHDVVLSSGHLHISEIWPLFEEARRRGVTRMICNHPTYVIDATNDDIATLASMGVYVEHSMCMFAEDSKFRFYDPPILDGLIKAGTVAKTILGSDLGQVGNPRVVDGFRSVISICLDLGYSEDDVRKMVSTNAAMLIGLEDEV
jgi:formylmethanofuran dehydrogenase subunit D